MFCKNCGKEVDDKALICIHCGCATGGLGVSNEWLITLLLAIFLGVFGAHRFYTGHKGTAVVMLVLTITCVGAFISTIWALVDIIMIALDNFRTFDGKLITRLPQ